MPRPGKGTDPNSRPVQADFKTIRDEILAMRDQRGRPIWTPGKLRQAMRDNPDARTWAEINAQFKVYLKNLKKGGW